MSGFLKLVGRWLDVFAEPLIGFGLLLGTLLIMAMIMPREGTVAGIHYVLHDSTLSLLWGGDR